MTATMEEPKSKAAVAYSEPKLSAKRRAQVEQGYFNFALPGKSVWVKPEQAARALDKKVDFIYSMIDEGRLEVIAPLGREVKRYSVTRRSVLLLLAAMSNFDPETHTLRILDLIEEEESAEVLGQIIVAATKRRARM